ncbi:MAG: hypothetical protein EBQ75_07130 [Actinobacteria bacterium]|nr:hypothetical protein [Actinomycetota bacterium]
MTTMPPLTLSRWMSTSTSWSSATRGSSKERIVAGTATTRSLSVPGRRVSSRMLTTSGEAMSRA